MQFDEVRSVVSSFSTKESSIMVVVVPAAGLVASELEEIGLEAPAQYHGSVKISAP